MLVICTIILISTCRSQLSQKYTVEGKQLEAHIHTKNINMKRKLWLYIGLLMMFVFGWVCALVATENINIIAVVIAVVGYAVFGAGQGIYLFIIVGVLNPTMRQDWKKFICSITRGC